jgi:hypothetical protein
MFEVQFLSIETYSRKRGEIYSSRVVSSENTSLLDRSHKKRFDGFCFKASALLILAVSTSVHAQQSSPSIFCGALQGYVCTPEQAFEEQRRQMQRRDPSMKSEGQQAYARWFYLEQLQKQRMELEALLPNR